MASTKQPKLRTFEDVFHRMRWDDTYTIDGSLIMGYEDRIRGWLEMPLRDFVPIAEGGELPMHRIWYLRSGTKILWDRQQKIDLVFGSGATSLCSATDGERDIHVETARRMAEAHTNLERLREEQQHSRHVSQHAAARASVSRTALRRHSLLIAAFRAYDVDKDGFLNADELWSFARNTGFEGNREGWGKEFGQLCIEFEAEPSAGIDIHVFETLVNDTSENGCHCSDVELEQVTNSMYDQTQKDRVRRNML